MTNRATFISFLIFISIASSQDIIPPGIKVIGSVLEGCIWGEESIFGCVEREAGSAIGRALEKDNLDIIPGVSLVKSGEESIAENDESNNKNVTLWENVDRLLSTRSLNIDFSGLQDSDEEEGRGKKKRRLLKYLFVAMATAAAITIPIKLKAIAAIAAKALMVGTLALVLASIIGLKKLVSKPDEETTHISYDTHRTDPASHYLAYQGHANAL